MFRYFNEKTYSKDIVLADGTIDAATFPINSLVADFPHFSFQFKGPYFGEEREWRVLIDGRGIYSKKQNMIFHSLRDRLVRHLELIVPDSGFFEVVFGPKNITPVSVVQQIVGPNVAVRGSGATYR